jgi:general nucleoside transport system permease protein
MSGIEITTFLKLTFLTMVPFIFSSQGTMLSGRTGVFIVAQEGIMLAGASIGFIISYLTGSNIVGVLAAAAVGGVFGLAMAYFTTTLRVNQFVIGLALFFFGMGISTLVPKFVIGVTMTPPLITTLKNIPIPFLSDIPFLGEILFNQNIMVYASILLSILLYYFLYHTQLGLEMRSVGENPKAADSLGINVSAMRYGAIIVGSMLIGVAGFYLPLVYTGTFTELMTRGRGWLSGALAFFGGWRPHTIFYGALFFAAIEVLAYKVQIASIGIPYQFLLMLPYVSTLIIMMLTFKRSTTPAFLGKNYDREDRSL